MPKNKNQNNNPSPSSQSTASGSGTKSQTKGKQREVINVVNELDNVIGKDQRKSSINFSEDEVKA